MGHNRTYQIGHLTITVLPTSGIKLVTIKLRAQHLDHWAYRSKHILMYQLLDFAFYIR